jgi:hypothetical protein
MKLLNCLFIFNCKQRKDWQSKTKRISHPYLSHATGNIVSGKQLEQFVQQLGHSMSLCITTTRNENNQNSMEGLQGVIPSMAMNHQYWMMKYWNQTRRQTDKSIAKC